MKDTIEKVLGAMEGVNRPQAKAMFTILCAFMCFIGRATYRNLSRYSDLDERTFSRWSHRPFDFAYFNSVLIKEELFEGRHLIGVIDASFVDKSGKCTEGIGNFWNGKESKACRGLEVSILGVVDTKSRTCYTIDARQTIDEEDRTRTELYAEQIKERSSSLSALGVTHVVADAYYSKELFLNAVSEAVLLLVGKLRKDANLWHLYHGPYGGKGRRRKYSHKVALSGPLDDWQNHEEREDGTRVKSAIVYSKRFKRKLKVVVLRKTDKEGNELQAVLFSTDLTLPPETITSYYELRFQIEFVIRDAKQFTGLGDCQALTSKQHNHHMNLSLSALNILKFEDRREKGSDEPSVISIDSMKRRKANALFIKTIFAKLDLDMSLINDPQALYDLERFGAIAA